MAGTGGTTGPGNTLTIDALFIGNFAAMDTSGIQTGDGTAENAASFVSSVQGTPITTAEGLALRPLEIHSTDTNEWLATNDNTSVDYYTNDYVIDAAAAELRIDAVIKVRVTVEYDSGSGLQSEKFDMNLMQFDNGDVYAWPTKDGGVSQTAFDNLGELHSISVDSLLNDDGAEGDELVWIDSTIVGTTVVCFAAGTLIRTIAGDVPVETLREGDLVVTRNGKAQPIRWIGSQKLDAVDLHVNPKLRPIRIRAGALGYGLPRHDLTVSPQHRMLVRSKIAKRLFGQREVLIAAKHLVSIEGIEEITEAAEVEYWHFLFDHHRIVWANGALSESLYLGPQALKSVGPAALDEIYSIFPTLRDRPHEKPPARPIATGRKARDLARRHVTNRHSLIMR